MAESSAPKILMLEANEASRQKTRKILEDQGWEVLCEEVSKLALTRLKQSLASPFHLFISNFKLPKMEGDDILTLARSISPMTQRMLMVPSDQSDMVIRAINKAEIHACIVTPASDRDLIDKVKSCIDQFEREMKHKRLKRVITHQNRQMFTIAQRLKKKNRLCREKIDTRIAEKVRLSTALRQANRQKKDPATLADRIRTHDIPITPKSLDAQFQKLAGLTRSLFDRAAGQAGLEPQFPGIGQIIAARNSPKASQTGHAELTRQILRTVFSSPEHPVTDRPEAVEDLLPENMGIETLIDIRLSKDLTQAFIRLERDITDPDLITLPGLLDRLRVEGIRFGIIDDPAIESWIKTARPGDDAFQIAHGEMPVPSSDGSVKFHFKTGYSNAGKIQEDGRIDFRDRGEIPFVEKGDLLAVKLPPKHGKNGMTVTGELIMVGDPIDPVFIAGSGTRLSEDGLTIHADQGGQPHLDPMGQITVNPELPINGDVDFQTGNIEFDGNIIVTGTVKDGFTVKGISLTAKEIEGATIDLTGDLHISDGITDAHIISVGSVYAKFINNSTVSAFGNVVIQKEIIDSQILLSGCCENPSGVIIASKIAAKGGVAAGKIGTETSKPARLRVGGDDHINARIADLEPRLKASLERLREIREEIERVETEDQSLYGRITEKAQEQEQVQRQINTLKQEVTELKNNNDQPGAELAIQEIQTLSGSLKKIVRDLNTLFETQDRYAKKIDRYKATMDEIETANKALAMEKQGLREFVKQVRPRPFVTAQGKITQETVIMGPNASITMREDRSRCRVSETAIEEDGRHYYEMIISDL